MVGSIKIGHLLPNMEDYLEEGVDSTEFTEIVELAYKYLAESEMHQRKGVAYAWRAGKEFERIKESIRHGTWTAWKEEFYADGKGPASPRKIEMYMMIAGGWESEEEASMATTSIVEAANIITEQRKAEKKGRVLTQSEEAEVERAASLRIAAPVELDIDAETYIHKAGVDGYAECGGDGLVLSKRLDAVNCPECLIAMEVSEVPAEQFWATVVPPKMHRNGQRPEHPDEQYLLNEYDLTPREWRGILDKQGGVCAICKSEDPRSRWQTDHDHSDGHVRGILCLPCNTRLGWYESRRRTIEAYLAG